MRDGIVMPKEIAELWNAINALGGRAAEYDDFGKGINHAIGQALFEIETRFQHVHVAGPDDMCRICGFHLLHDIHERIKT